MSALVSSLWARVPAGRLSSTEQDEAAREAWRAGSDLVALRLSVIVDDWTRQAIINELTRQYGAKPKRR